MRKKYAGFSLIELVFVIIILAIIGAIASKTIETGFRAYFTNQDISIVNAQARIAFARMTRDLHAVASPSSITTATASQLVFTDTAGNSLNYQITGGNLTLNNKVLLAGVAGNGASSAAFVYRDRDANITSTLSAIRYVSINLLITQNNVSYPLRTTVYLINLT